MEFHEEYYPPKPELQETNQNGVTRSLISLGLFIGLFYILFQDTRVMFLIVLILFIHEMGHFIAMKAFGYKDVNMFFIPLMGAMVTGEKDRVSLFQRSIIILAGPLPGILIGWGMTEYAISIQHNELSVAGISFIFINLINLLPIDPLDGGRLIETLFFSSNEKVKKAFLIISVVGMTIIGLYYGMYILAIMGFFMFTRFKVLQNLTQLRDKIKNLNIQLVKTYEELTDKEYWSIRKAYLESSNLSKVIDPQEMNPSPYEAKIAKSVKNILIVPVKKDITIVGKIIFLLLWLAGILLPIWYTLPFLMEMYNSVGGDI